MFARRDAQIEVAENFRVALVTEIDVRKFNRLRSFEFVDAFGGEFIRFGQAHQLAITFDARHAPLINFGQHHQLKDGTHAKHHVKQEGNQVADGHRAETYQRAAEDDYRQVHDVGEEIDAAVEFADGAERFFLNRQKIFARAEHFVEFLFFAAENFYEANALQTLGDLSAEVAGIFARAHEHFFHVGVEFNRRESFGEEKNRDDECQLPVQIKKQSGGAEQSYRAGDE